MARKTDKLAVADFPLIDETLLKSRIYTIREVKVMLDADLVIRQSMALIRLFKQMKDYIVAENQLLLGNNGITGVKKINAAAFDCGAYCKIE